MPNANSYGMFVKLVSKDENVKVIDSLNKNKSVAHDDIPTEIMKACKKQIEQPLQIIINKSFITGSFLIN